MLRAVTTRARDVARDRAIARAMTSAREIVGRDSRRADGGAVTGDGATVASIARDVEGARASCAWASAVEEGGIVDGGLGSRVLEMWLMAVPKRKVTPSRRKRRN